MRKILLAGVAILGMVSAGSALAVPCGNVLFVGGIYPVEGCRNGPDNDTAASESDLNGFFGFSNWSLLDVSTRSGVSPADPANPSFWSVSYVLGGRAGTFTLASGITNLFSDLVVVLADSAGSYTNSAIKWSAYLLRDPGLLGSDTFLWSYDNRNKVSTVSLFGIPLGQSGTNGAGGGNGSTAVSEPATLSLVLLGLGLAGWAWRRQRA